MPIPMGNLNPKARTKLCYIEMMDILLPKVKYHFKNLDKHGVLKIRARFTFLPILE